MRQPDKRAKTSRKATGMGAENIPRTIWWEDGKVYLIDQSRLPRVGDVLVCSRHEGICAAISSMALRGAPALGVAAALGLALWTENQSWHVAYQDQFIAELERIAAEITATRPTAVNLLWGAERILKAARDNSQLPLEELKALVVKEALNILAEDEDRNRAIGEHGASLIPEGASILTHCNAGSLATAYYGTALGVVFAAHEQGKVSHVWVDETRPVMQGARLTAWELIMAGVPCALITDSMAGWIMRKGLVDVVIVGADRIAANGDVANKIGTYSLALLAKRHGIPFYVAAPSSTIDLTLATGDEIAIEERDPREVTGLSVSATFEVDEDARQAFDLLTEGGPRELDLGKENRVAISRKGEGFQLEGWFGIAPPGVPVYNPAFDVTPAEYVNAIVTENGIARPDYAESLRAIVEGTGAIHELGGS